MWLTVATFFVASATVGWAQPAQGPNSTARVELIPLVLTDPSRYQTLSIVEPARSIGLAAMADGVVRSLAVPVGSTVRESQEVVLLDRLEATYNARVADAGLKEKQAMLRALQESKVHPSELEIAQAQVEAAQAMVDLAKLRLERCTLRAPFAGRLLRCQVVPGQFVRAGEVLATIAETTSLQVVIPVSRSAAGLGTELRVQVEGKEVLGKLQALLPLPAEQEVLRELAAPLASGVLTIPNTQGTLEPGERVLSPFLPTSPVATIPSRAIRRTSDQATTGLVQVVRNDYVTDLPVRILGPSGPERAQVSASFRPNDQLILEAQPPLIAGTLVRMNSGLGQPPIEGMAPAPGAPGTVVDTVTPRVSPIGPPGSAIPKGAVRGGVGGGATKGGTSPAGSGSSTGSSPVPF